jgi:hypothetical protein
VSDRRPAWPWYLVTVTILVALLIADLGGVFDGLGP